MKNEIFTLADKTKQYLISQRETLDLPFINNFPFSCCEISSLILGKIINEICKNKDILLVEGYDRENDEYHFWLEVDSVVVDITSNQFSTDHKGCGAREYVENKFSDTEKTLFSDVILNNALMVNNHEKIQHVTNEIKKDIKGSLYVY